MGRLITPILHDIKAKQLRAGPGVRIARPRKYGVNTCTLITPHAVRRHTHVDGSLSWSRFQTYMISARNDPRLADLPVKHQIGMVRFWYHEASSAHTATVFERYNSDHDRILRKLQEEEKLRREHNVHFTFLGSNVRFMHSYKNFAQWFLYTGQAHGGIGARPPFPFRPTISNAARTERRHDPAARATVKATPSSTVVAHKRKRRRRLGAAEAKLYFDKTTLSLFDTSQVGKMDLLTPSSAPHWTHKALLSFAQLPEHDQDFFSMHPAEEKPWRRPNSRRAQFLRFLQRRVRAPDFRARRLHGAEIYPALVREYRSATAEELKAYLDTSHVTKFPLNAEASRRW
jgi:hypothetical protein